MAFTARFGYRLKDTRKANCQSSDAIGDFVCISGDPVGGIDTVTKADPTDFNKMPAVGVIVAKDGPTQCLVQWFGETPEIFSGLSSGEIYFVGLDSKIAERPPLGASPTFSQSIGVATASNRLYLSPDNNMTKRLP